MAKTKGKKVGVFNFTNWPGKTDAPTLSDRSASVVDDFLSLLDPASNARVVGLEVMPGLITMLRRKRKPRVDDKFFISFDLYGSRTVEKSVALVFADPAYRDYLREMVDAASGRSGFSTSVSSLIAGRVFTTTIGINR